MFSATGGLRPDHPLLRRAQEALKTQFEATKLRLEDELREKANALKVMPCCVVPPLIQKAPAPLWTLTVYEHGGASALC